MRPERTNLTKSQALRLYESGFWNDMKAQDIARFQLFEDRLCMPFDVFQQAMQETLGRSVCTHEFASPDLLRSELLGERDAPSFQEILALIPEDKLILLQVPS